MIKIYCIAYSSMQGKIETNCYVGSFGTILVCTNYPMTIHNKVVHQLNPPSSIQHIKVLIEFHFLHKFCMETRCFLEKFTQLEKNLHDRWSQRSWQISSLTCIITIIITNIGSNDESWTLIITNYFESLLLHSAVAIISLTKVQTPAKERAVVRFKHGAHFCCTQ